jgi:hypothetical protein
MGFLASVGVSTGTKASIADEHWCPLFLMRTQKVLVSASNSSRIKGGWI